MKPQQARANTQARQRAIELKHNHCPVEFRVQGPHTGMYCQTHDVWIRWISKQDLKKIALNDA
jgi:hypothetical protein